MALLGMVVGWSAGAWFGDWAGGVIGAIWGIAIGASLPRGQDEEMQTALEQLKARIEELEIATADHAEAR